MRSFTLRTHCVVGRLLAAALLFNAGVIFAQNGTWTNLSSGDYFTPGNWAGNQVAQGANNTANFNTLNIASDIEVSLNSALTIGNMTFGDTNLGSAGTWAITTTALETSVITLDNGGSPAVITVNELTPTAFDDVFIGNSIAGAAGLTKAGAGILTLGPGTTNTITGGINVNAGTLRLQAAVPGQAINIGNGATLETSVTLDANTTHTINVATGETATINALGTLELGNFNASGATLNIHQAGAAGTTLTADGNWAINGAAANMTVSSAEGAFFRLRPNSGSPNFNTATAFATTHLTLDNITMWTRSNSGGNDVNIGALSGSETAIIAGGAQGGGTAPRYIIGSLNTDTTFAGMFDSTFDLPDPEAGLHVVKVGTGKLTISGGINSVPRAAGTSAATLPWRRGGVTQIQNGTLALVDSAIIAGGATEMDAGALFSTIDIQTNGRLDVTGYTAGTYATQTLQQIVGSGNIDGNWNHAAGIIRPANTVPDLGGNAGITSPNTTAVGGTITFNGDLALSGGDIGYDMSLDPNAGNDLVHVTGSVNVTGGSIIPSFFSGIPSSGTYTVLTADGGITGNIGSMTVNFPGRGVDPAPFIEGNSIKFSAVAGGGSANLIWTGANGGIWNVETTQAWTNNGSPDVFFDLDNVTFNDAPANATVSIAQPVSPSSVVLNNPTTHYTFTSTGGNITGGTGFTKTGAGNLTIQMGNSFIGTASLQGGTIDVGTSGTAFGVGPLAIDGVTIVGTTANGFGNTSLTATGTNLIQMEGNAGSANTFTLPALSGSGALTITSTIPDKWIALNNTTNYSGTINLTGAAGMTPMHVRIVANSAYNVLNVNDARISVRSGTGGGTNTMAIGELHGNSNTVLRAFEGGSPAVNAIWQIGGANNNSDFAGVIEDGAGSGMTTSVSHVQKVGTGTLTLTGPNTYTGDTIIDAGTLSINQAYLADTANVFIANGAFFDLMFGGSDDINFLYLGGNPVAPGLYGAANSMGRITGSGMLNVLFQGPDLGLDGDYNDDGVVNAADYVVWRNNEGTANVLPNDPIGGTIGAAHYNQWVANFGTTGGVGAGLAGAVPEPSALAMLMLVMGSIAGCRRVGRG